MDWYEERREGLGGELLELARESFERILEAPHQLPAGPVIEGIGGWTAAPSRCRMQRKT